MKTGIHTVIALAVICFGQTAPAKDGLIELKGFEKTDVTFSPDDSKIVSESWTDRTLRICDTETGKAVITVTPDLSSHPYRVRFSSDGKRVITHNHSTLQLWETETGKKLATLTDLRYPLPLFSPSGKKALAGTDTSKGFPSVWKCVVLDAETGKEIVRLDNLCGHDDPVIVFSPDEKKIAVLQHHYGGDVALWDVEKGKFIADIRHAEGTKNWHSVRFSPDSKKVITASKNWEGNVPCIWDAETGKEITKLKVKHLLELGFVVDAFFFPDSKRAGTTGRTDGDKGAARIWDTETGKEIRRFRDEDASTYAVFSPDYEKAVTMCGRFPSIRIWDTETGKKLGELITDKRTEKDKQMRTTAHGGRAETVFSPDSKRVGVNIRYDGSTVCYLMEADTGKILMQSQSKEVSDDKAELSFSSDSKAVLVSGLHYETKTHNAYLLDAASGKKFFQMSFPAEQGQDLPRTYFLSDTKKMAVCRKDGTIQIAPLSYWADKQIEGGRIQQFK